MEVVMRKQGMPEKGEVVVCRIKKIFPNSAYAELIEYGKTGMIHVSEVALKWVRDIREFLKLNQYVVCRVMKVEGENISLSIKRVRRQEADSKLSEFKREAKAEKLLENVAKDIGKSLDDAYREIGAILQEEFGSLRKVFEIAVKNPGLLEAKGVPKEWAKRIAEAAKKSLGEKTYEVRAELRIACYAPDGIEVIKKALLNATKGKNVEARYLSAPRYLLLSKGKNFKKVRAEVEEAAKAVEKAIKGSQGSCEVRIVE